MMLRIKKGRGFQRPDEPHLRNLFQRAIKATVNSEINPLPAGLNIHRRKPSDPRHRGITRGVWFFRNGAEAESARIIKAAIINNNAGGITLRKFQSVSD